MQKKLLSGLFWVLLANLVVKPLWLLGIEVEVQNTVGNAQYGFYYALFSFSYIFNILLDMGITNFNTRNIAQHPQLIGKHLPSLLAMKLWLMVPYLVCTFGVGLAMGYGSEEFRLLALLCLCQGLNSLVLYLRSNFEGLLLFGWGSLFSVLDRLLMVAICGCLLWSPLRERFDIHWFVYAQLVAYSLTASLALVVIGRRSGLRGLRWKRTFFLAILKQSAPFALLVLLMASYNRIDPVLLRRLSGDAAAGLYAGAFRLLDALTMVAYLVSVPLLPVYARLCRSDRGGIAGATRTVFAPMMVFAVGTSLAGSLLADPLMELLYPGRGGEYAPVFRVVVYGIVPISLTYIFGTLLTAGGHLRQLNIFAAMSLALNVVVNLLLIPRLGAVGSAWASLTAQGFMALSQVVLAVRLFGLPARSFLPPGPREAAAMLRQAKERFVSTKSD